MTGPQKSCLLFGSNLTNLSEGHHQTKGPLTLVAVQSKESEILGALSIGEEVGNSASEIYRLKMTPTTHEKLDSNPVSADVKGTEFTNFELQS